MHADVSAFNMQHAPQKSNVISIEGMDDIKSIIFAQSCDQIECSIPNIIYHSRFEFVHNDWYL